MIVVRCP